MRHPPAWLVVVLPVAIAAYFGAGRWVAFAFVPARLLFLLPFFLLLLVRGAESSRRAGWIVCSAMLLLSAGSISSYFRRADFLNKAYVLPYSQIAGVINRGSADRRAVVVADVSNTDPGPLTSLLWPGIPVIPAPAAVRESLEGAGVIWCFRNTHDTSPAGLNRSIERELAEGRRVRTHLFVPYSPRDRFMMRLLGWVEQPTHYVQLLEMRQK